MNLPSDLVASLEKNQVVLFLGAGISMSTTEYRGFPGGHQLAKSLSNKFLNRDIAQCESLLDISQQIIWLHGGSRATIENYLLEVFKNSQITPNKSHNLLAQLQLPMVTTNYDQLIEVAYAQNNRELSVNIGDDDLTKRGKNTLFKIHGCISNPKNCVIAESDYYNWMNGDNMTKDLLRAMFVMNHIVFVGYSISDMNFRALLLELRRKFGRNLRRCYVVAPSFDIAAYSYNYAKNELGAGFIESTAETFLLALTHYYTAEYQRYDKKYQSEYFSLVDNQQYSFLDFAAHRLLDDIVNNCAGPVELDEIVRSKIFQLAKMKKDYIYSSSLSVEAPDGMVYVPPGEFIRGGSRHGNEIIRVSSISHGFYIDETPVTNAMYRYFISCVSSEGDDKYKHTSQPPSKSHLPNPDFTGSSAKDVAFRPLPDDYFINKKYNDFPVVNIDWWDAYAYAQWEGKRLPLEAEWEKAARGIDGRIFPYGDTFSHTWSNVADSNISRTNKVTQFPKGRSPYGCYDMSGNVWEWCQDEFQPLENNNNCIRIVRGGSFSRGQEKARSDFRNGRKVGDRWITRGFRCVKDLDD